MLDPLTAITVAATALKGIKSCVDNSEALWGSLKKYANAIEDAREHVRNAKEFGQKNPKLYGKFETAKIKNNNPTDSAFDIIIMEEKIRQHEKELYQFFTANWTADWGGRPGWIRFKKLREEIRDKKEKEIYAAIRRKKQFMYHTKLGVAVTFLSLLFIYLCWFLYNAIVESSK